MGSKTRIISHICEPIIKNKSIKTVVDLFAGTGSVGYALKAHKNIISNDLEYYAYIINHARIHSSFRLQYIPLRGMQLSNIRVF